MQKKRTAGATLRRKLRETRARLEAVQHEVDCANDALRSARQALGSDDAPFVCDAIAKVRRERDEAAKRVRAFLDELHRSAISHFVRGQDDPARVLREASKRGYRLLFPVWEEAATRAVEDLAAARIPKVELGPLKGRQDEEAQR